MYQASINKGPCLNVVMSAYDRYHGDGIIMLSGFGYATAVKTIVRDIKKKCEISMHYVRYNEAGKALTAITSHMTDSDYTHIVLYKKDQTYNRNGEERLKLFIFVNIPDESKWKELYQIYHDEDCPEALTNAVYDKLYKMCPVPILKEWTPFLIRYFINESFMYEANSINSDGIPKFFCGVIDVSVNDIIDRIKFGLQENYITINGGATSAFMNDVEGIDAYLSEFSEVLTRKIQKSFVPMFIPGKDPYCKDLQIVYDYMKCNDKISLYPAQTAVAQAVTNAFNNGKRCCFIIAECGSGKTALSIATVNSHFAAFKRKKPRDYMNNIVVCPAHLVNMWKREIENRSPRSKAIIVKDFSHLISLIPEIKGKKRYQHLWLIISKEIAKLGYELRPAVEWREHRKIPGTMTIKTGVFVCPVCGKPTFFSTTEGRGRYKRVVHNYHKESDFRSPSIKRNNITCENKVRFWNKATNDWELKVCGANLWGPSTKETIYDGKAEHEDRWIKLPRQGGWMQRRHLQRIYDRLAAQSEQTSEDLQLMTAISDELSGNGIAQRAPAKYPIAKFIKRYLKGYINYAILDEVHVMKSKDSLQGEAMGDITSTAKYSLALTGTLLNGYCSGIFYLLFRMFSNQMIKEGYEFKSGQEFSKDYGVIKTSRWYEMRYGSIGNSVGAAQIKEMPGISPIVFTKFLLENAAFISLEDIADALPGYEEIPIPLEMTDDLRYAYESLTENAKEALRLLSDNNDISSSQRSSMISQIVQLLSVYPDQPYDQPSVINPETGESILVPEDVLDQERVKENALLAICQEKIEAGEHVLVYYSWTNRTNIKDLVPRYLESFGIRTAVLTTAVKPQDREAWIQQQVNNGIQVIFCNPTLVETGLTLLDFTTIVFYQVTYNLYTMRQASRRSWRINQDHDVQVYFLYYQGTVQEQALSLMATKLQAAMAIEGKFSEEGLNAMSNNEDILTQIATSVTEGIKETVDVQVFQKHKLVHKKEVQSSEENENDIIERKSQLECPISFNGGQASINEETASVLNKIHESLQS